MGEKPLKIQREKKKQFGLQDNMPQDLINDSYCPSCQIINIKTSVVLMSFCTFKNLYIISKWLNESGSREQGVF